MSAMRSFPGKGSFARGVHPPDNKGLSADQKIEVVPAPSEVILPLLQHTGAPCKTTVTQKQSVRVGDRVGDADAPVSAPVHASINGVVGKLSVVTLPNARHVNMLPIQAEGEQLEGQALYDEVLGGSWALDKLEEWSPEALAKRVREAGIVGLGGAAFPTSVKLVRNAGKPAEILLLNGCECEPYLTADYRIMIEAPAAVIAGALIAAKSCGARETVIAIEDNKPEAIQSLRTAAAGTAVRIAVLETKYPMGGERQTVPAVTGRVVPTGGLPLDVGVVVINVGTAVAVAGAVLRGRNLTHRVVTVTGEGIRQPKNLLVPIGISYRVLIDYCGGMTADTTRIISGGPMMGFAVNTVDIPVTKGTSGILLLTEKNIRMAEETSCIRCGRCVDACPLNLIPTRLAMAVRHREWPVARRYHLQACMECGCCAYVCPASIPLVQLIRMGKVQMPRE